MASYTTNAPHFGRHKNYRDIEKAQRYWEKKRKDPNYKGGNQAAVMKLKYGKDEKDVKEEKVDEQLGASWHHLLNTKERKQYDKDMAEWEKAKKEGKVLPPQKGRIGPLYSKKKDMKEEKIPLPTEYNGEYSVRNLYTERQATSGLSRGYIAHGGTGGFYGTVANEPARAARPAARPAKAAPKPAAVQRPVTRPTNVPAPVRKPAAPVAKPAAPTATPPLPTKKPVGPATTTKPSEIVAKPGPTNTTPGSGPNPPPVPVQKGPNNTTPGSGVSLPPGNPAMKGAGGGVRVQQPYVPSTPNISVPKTPELKATPGPTSTTPGSGPNAAGTPAFKGAGGAARVQPSLGGTPSTSTALGAGTSWVNTKGFGTRFPSGNVSKGAGMTPPAAADEFRYANAAQKLRKLPEAYSGEYSVRKIYDEK